VRLSVTGLWMAIAGLMVCMAVVEVAAIWGSDLLASDFRVTLWEPAKAVANGGDPYAHPLSVYPPSAYVPLIPLGMLSFPLAASLWILVSLAAAATSLIVLGVRDRRCYVLWLLNSAVLSTAVTGNATAIIGLCIALLVVFADRVAGPLALAAGIAIKLFVAPLALWLAFTGRGRGALIALATASVAVVVAWAVIGFQGLTGYPDQLSDNNAAYSSSTPLVQGLVQQLGGSQDLALIIGLACAGVLLLGAWRARADEIGSLALVLAAAIVASPIAWVGYATLLAIPLAARTRGYTHAWLILLGFSYLHWWWSPLPFRSIGLSVATIALTGCLLLAVVRPAMTVRRAPKVATDVGPPG
jgi:hypothetical protein